MGTFDDIPAGMKHYLNTYGYHFNKKLCKEAVSRMYYEKDGAEHKLDPYSKKDVEDILKAYGIEVERNKLYDAVYVANMCKADFLGKSVPTEEHLAKYVKDVLDDADAEEGYVFNRFYADTCFMEDPIEWEDMI